MENKREGMEKTDWCCVGKRSLVPFYKSSYCPFWDVPGVCTQHLIQLDYIHHQHLQQGIKSDEAPFSLTSAITAWLESVFNPSWAFAFPMPSAAVSLRRRFLLYSFLLLLPVKEIPMQWSTGHPWNDGWIWQYTAGEIDADPCPIPQKASTSSSLHPLLLGLAPGMFHRINFSYKGILFYIDFFVWKKAEN